MSEIDLIKYSMGDTARQAHIYEYYYVMKAAVNLLADTDASKSCERLESSQTGCSRKAHLIFLKVNSLRYDFSAKLFLVNTVKLLLPTLLISRRYASLFRPCPLFNYSDLYFANRNPNRN